MSLLLSPDHAATLTDPLTWKDNPFIAREQRRDIKRRQPFVSFCWMSGLLLLSGLVTAYILWVIHVNFHQIPWFIGGDFGTGLCMIVSGVQVWFIAGAAQKHTTRFFTQESNQNTLSSLLMLPTSPFQLMIQATAYPWLVAMRMAVAMLPVYVLCVGLDGPTWIELLMLYLVFAMVAFSVPFWQRPALSENVGILTAPRPARAGRAADLAANRRARAAGTTGLPGGILAVTCVIPWSMSVAAWASRQYPTMEPLHAYVPHGITDLLSWSPVSWPLMLARLLVTPLDWFGIPLVPLFFIIVLFPLVRYTQLVRASEFLSVGAFRDLPLQSTYLPRRRMEAGIRIAQALVLTGYLWKWAVTNGGLASFAPGLTGGASGLAGFACLLLGFSTLWGLSRGMKLGFWQKRRMVRGERNILLRTGLVSGARYLLEPFALALLFYLACCLLARAQPFPTLVNSPSKNLGVLFCQMEIIGLAGALLSFGASRLLGDMSMIPRMLVPMLVVFSALYETSPEIQQWLASFPQVAHSLGFLPSLERLEIFSPVMGLLHVAAPHWTGFSHLLKHPPAWQQWPLVDCLVGIAMWGIAHALGMRRAQAPQEGVVTLVFDPTLLGQEVFSDPVLLKRSGLDRGDTPFVRALIARLQRFWDNAIVTREMRSRLRGRWDRTACLTALGAALLVSLAFFHPSLAVIPSAVGGWLAYLLMGSMKSDLAATAAGILGCWYLGLFLMAFCFSFSTSGAFYMETERSTLGFLLATPMSSRAILMGKLVGVLAPSLGILVGLSGWILALTVLFLPLVGPLALVGWGEAVLTAFTVYLMFNGITFTVSALFPRLSMANAGWIWLLLLWFGIWPLTALYAMLSAFFLAMGLQGASLWMAYILLGWMLVGLSYVIALSSIHTMRRRDLSFANTKQSN